MLEESDTYLMILERGEERARRSDVLLVGEKRLGTADQSIRDELERVADRERLKRMLSNAVTAASWQEILDTP